jgi:hypothetical protein
MGGKQTFATVQIYSFHDPAKVRFEPSGDIQSTNSNGQLLPEADILMYINHLLKYVIYNNGRYSEYFEERVMTLKVIGAGFGRTATASLKVALETLLHAPCYHMSEVLGNAGHIDLWLDAAADNPDWNAIFGNYVATVDFPASNYWRELANVYPEAKIVLSVRDAERWFQSTQETIFSKALQELHSGTKWSRMIKATIDDHIGGDSNDRETVIAAFDAHVVGIQNAFDSDRLLVFEAKDGWEPLCNFLGVPVPEGLYPHINSKEEFGAVIELLRSPIGAQAMNGDGMDSGSAHEDFFETE